MACEIAIRQGFLGDVFPSAPAAQRIAFSISETK